MSTSNNSLHLPPPPEYPSTSAAAAAAVGDPLANLTSIRNRVDSLSHILSNSVNSNTPLSQHASDTISSELISAVHLIIINGAALITPPHHHHHHHDHHNNNNINNDNNDFEIIELDAVDLTADNNSHTCQICFKTFKRDANLRMHMRAHGDQFKTLESLSKPDNLKSYSRKTRFSCPNLDCNRNKNHKDFRPLKSVICVKNHFKRSHCPKKYTCCRCSAKSFSVLSDLKSHMKQCLGESNVKKWKCSCSIVFESKSEFFRHMSAFEGHMPIDDGGGGGGGGGSNGIELLNDDDQHLDLWSSIQELIRF